MPGVSKRWAAASTGPRSPRGKPLWRALLLDDNGELSLEVVNADGTSDFDIFDPDGRLLGRVATGVRRSQYVQPRLRNGRLHLIALDDMDVQYLYVFRVEALRG